MLKYLQAAWKVDPKTRWFWFQVFIYSLAIIISTIYCYARLDFVRSYDKTKAQNETKKSL